MPKEYALPDHPPSFFHGSACPPRFRGQRRGGQQEDDRGNGSPTALHDHNISIPYSNVRAVNPKSVDAAET